jgi:hypothetical protein
VHRQPSGSDCAAAAAGCALAGQGAAACAGPRHACHILGAGAAPPTRAPARGPGPQRETAAAAERTHGRGRAAAGCRATGAEASGNPNHPKKVRVSACAARPLLPGACVVISPASRPHLCAVLRPRLRCAATPAACARGQRWAWRRRARRAACTARCGRSRKCGRRGQARLLFPTPTRASPRAGCAAFGEPF